MKKIIFLIIIFLLLCCIFKEKESFISSIRGFKNRKRREIRHAVRDGFTQIKHSFPIKYFL